MIRKLREARENEEGFTLIELLVVVIIIGILAAIAIPAFLSQRESARRGAAESDARNAAIAIETAMTVNDEYPAETAPNSYTLHNTTAAGAAPVWYVHDDGTITSTSVTDRAEITVSKGVTLVYTNNLDNTYTIVATHEDVAGGAESITYDSGTGGLDDTWS